MRKFISEIPDFRITDDFTTAVNAALVPMEAYKINLTDGEKTSLRTMGEGREGYARLISRIATQFPNSLSRADSPQDLSELLDYYQNLEANRLALSQAIETIEEIQLGAGVDIMNKVDRFAENLTISRANEGSLDIAMRDVDDYNRRFGVRKNDDTPDTP